VSSVSFPLASQACPLAKSSRGRRARALRAGGSREIIFFKDKPTLEYFKTGNFEFAAQASAILVNEGASKDYHKILLTVQTAMDKGDKKCPWKSLTNALAL